MSKRKDLTGKVFGRLTVIECTNKKQNGKYIWRCKCSCGQYKDILGTCLTNGTVQSCGCFAKEQISRANTKHGLSQNNLLYGVWNSMINRCNNCNDVAFVDYGERGIEVCEEWLNINVFMEWALNNGYEKGLTIDRIDVNGNYEPLNCRWITNKMQQNNRRNNVLLEFNGQIKTLQEWSEIYNIPHYVVRNRLKRGWKKEDLFKQPITKKRKGE